MSPREEAVLHLYLWKMPFQNHGCAAMVIISAGSVQGQREPLETSVPPSLFHREFYCKKHEVCWEQGDEAEHSPCSCPTFGVKELLCLPCAGAMNFSVSVPSSLC